MKKTCYSSVPKKQWVLMGVYLLGTLIDCLIQTFEGSNPSGTKYVFKNGPFVASFSSFEYSWHCIGKYSVLNIAYDWVQTVDLWCRNNHSANWATNKPELNMFIKLIGETFEDVISTSPKSYGNLKYKFQGESYLKFDACRTYETEIFRQIMRVT